MSGIFDSISCYVDCKGSASDVMGNLVFTANAGSLTTDHIGLPNAAYATPNISSSASLTIGTNDYAILIVFKRTSAWSATEAIISDGNSAYQFEANCPSSTTLQIVENGNSIRTFTWSLSDTNWHSLIITRISGTLYSYLDGNALSGSGSDATNNVAWYPRIGVRSDGASLQFHGNVSRFLIWNNRGFSASDAAMISSTFLKQNPYPYCRGERRLNDT